jgi:hypothetical protein
MKLGKVTERFPADIGFSTGQREAMGAPLGNAAPHFLRGKRTVFLLI